MTWKGNKSTLSSDFSIAIFMQKNRITYFKLFKARTCEAWVLYPGILTFKCKGHSKTITNQ